MPALDALPARTHLVIVGAGFSGMAMVIKAREAGITDLVLLERGTDVGGTWRDNTYPGAACDVPSHLYSFSFAPNPGWTRTFSAQPEIYAYMRRVARDHDVYSACLFGTTVEGARWDDTTMTWTVQTSRGEIVADVLVSGMGALSDPSIPNIQGAADFRGTTFHSAEWDHDYDLTGKKVAVIGTGASAIQFVPEIAKQVAKLSLFQRTPPWVMPRPDRAVTKVERAVYARSPLAQRVMRDGIYWLRETYVLGFRTNSPIMKALSKRASGNITKAVKDPALVKTLTPDYTLGCKRILLSDAYYPAVARPNVDVVATDIAEITATGVRTTDGVLHEVDAIIWGTGFKVTDLPASHSVHGRDGRTMAETWDGSMRAYLGSTVPNFPNFFFIVGPNTGLGHSSMVYMIEASVDYAVEALKTMRSARIDVVEVKPSALDEFNDGIQETLAGAVWTRGGCKSWYLDKQGRNTTLWPSFTFEYRNRTSRFDATKYETRVRPRATAGV